MTSSSPSTDAQPLAGRTIVTTRPEAGAVDAALTALGAQVFHLPLLHITDAESSSLGELETLLNSVPTQPGVTYLAVTSSEGARRTGALVARSAVRLAAVGTATAAILAERAGRAVDIVPARQTAADLVDAFPAAQVGDRVIVAQADRAANTLVDGLRGLGYDVHALTVYRTELRIPDAEDLATALAADAVVFASGSAAESWSGSIGTATPPRVIAIGPTTAAVATSLGLTVTDVATEHSVDGLVAATVAALNPSD